MTLIDKYMRQKWEEKVTHKCFYSGCHPQEFAVPSQDKPKHGFIGQSNTDSDSDFQIFIN